MQLKCLFMKFSVLLHADNVRLWAIVTHKTGLT